MSAAVPVLVGAGEVVDRPADPRDGREPLALMEAAARTAADDAGAAGIFAALDTIAVVTNVFHDYGDTATLLAERLGARPRRRIVTTWGGNTPQALLNALCDDVVAGRSSLALIAGAEAVATMRALGKLGIEPAWTPHRATDVPRWGDMRSGTSDLESRHGAREAYVTFALIENAFRAARGLTFEDARHEIGAFAERASAIAAANPTAWFRDRKDAATLTTVTRENRMVAFPYPKYLNAIMDVNQGAALLLASAEAARALGVAADRWVYPWAGADVTEQWFLLDRPAIHEIAGTRRAAAALFETVGRSVAGIEHLDLYSCFPIAPRLSASALGLDPATDRPLTAAGGLPWFGGPGNDYGAHAVAALMRLLREAPDTTALAHGLGWSCTKHALGVFGGRPSPRGWERVDTNGIQATIDATPGPTVVAEASGPARVETYTIVHGRDGAPDRGVVVARLPDDRRTMAVLPADRPTLEGFERIEGVGRAGRLERHDGRNVFHPA